MMAAHAQPLSPFVSVADIAGFTGTYHGLEQSEYNPDRSVRVFLSLVF